jgi:glutamyl-tRNA reductase
MNFYLIGVNYKNANIETRETLLSLRQEIINFWQNRDLPFTILSTCNRFEIYSISADTFTALNQRDSFYERFALWRNGYFLNGELNVFRHALRLASGLESQLKGETQISQQMASWVASEGFPEIFKELWHKASVAGVNNRAFSGLDNKERNIANLIFDDLGKKYSDADPEAIIAGTGNIAKLFAQNKPKGLQLNFVSTKHHLRAKKLAESAGGQAMNFKELPRRLLAADFLITATLSPHFILKRADIFETVVKRTKPLYIYDLALPRVVQPEVSNLKNIILQNLDDLVPLFERENLKIQARLKKAEVFVEEAVKDYEKDIKIRHPAKPLSFAAS